MVVVFRTKDNISTLVFIILCTEGNLFKNITKYTFTHCALQSTATSAGTQLKSVRCTSGKSRFESRPPPTRVVTTGSNSSSVKCSATSVHVTNCSEDIIKTYFPQYSRCITLKNPHCSLTMSAEHTRGTTHKVITNSWRHMTISLPTEKVLWK